MTPRETAEQLAARLRHDRDEQALAEAYRRVFDWELGRFVLASILAEAGLAQRAGPELGGEFRAWRDGRLSLALDIMNRAGFDQASAAVTILDLSDELKGRTHERDDDGGPGFGGPDDAADFLDD